MLNFKLGQRQGSLKVSVRTRPTKGSLIAHLHDLRDEVPRRQVVRNGHANAENQCVLVDLEHLFHHPLRL